MRKWEWTLSWLLLYRKLQLAKEQVELEERVLESVLDYILKKLTKMKCFQ